MLWQSHVCISYVLCIVMLSNAEAVLFQETNNDTQGEDLRIALSYSTQFNRAFSPTDGETELPTVINDREFAASHYPLRCFDLDVELITEEKNSSSLKSSNFIVHFIQPPFCSEIHDDSRGFRYKQWVLVHLYESLSPTILQRETVEFSHFLKHHTCAGHLSKIYSQE